MHFSTIKTALKIEHKRKNTKNFESWKRLEKIAKFWKFQSWALLFECPTGNDYVFPVRKKIIDQN